MATAYGCPGTSSGRTSIGVWHARTKSRVTVKTKSALARYILFRKASTISIVMSGRRAQSAGPRQHGRDETLGCALQQVPDEGAADAEAQHQELPDAQVIHQAELVVGVCVPGPVDLQRAGGLAGVGVAQVRRDAAVLALELLPGVEGVVLEGRERGVQPAARDDHQREVGADRLVVNANVSLLIKRHLSLSFQRCARRPMSEAMPQREHTISESYLSMVRAFRVL